MAGKRLSELRVENFRSLREIALPLGPVNVLVGPNGAGKTNVLEVFRFLADVVRTDLGPALEQRGGFGRLAFRGGAVQPAYIQIGITGSWSPQQSTRPDEYTLRIAGSPLAREEIFRSGAYPHRLRTITVLGETARAKVVDEPHDSSAETPTRHIGLEDHGHGADSLSVDRGDEVEEIGIQPLSSGLSTLPRLSSKGFSMEPMRVAALLGSFRIFDVDVARACLPSRVAPGYEPILADASNLAGFLLRLRDADSDAWERLQADAVEVLPQLESLDFDYPSGGAHSVVVVLRERGLRETTPLLDASFGTIRLLGLLAMLYDPDPPALTCVEEIDHGLHPQALELLMERIREASEKTQFIIATHSPALADRLKPEEIVICERGDDGSSLIPAVSTAKVEEIVRASEGLPLGELWFSGVLGGDL